jgi:hypothetical protein
MSAVRTIALSGIIAEVGWPGGTDPTVQYNTLVDVACDQELFGLGIDTNPGALGNRPR